MTTGIDWPAELGKKGWDRAYGRWSTTFGAEHDVFGYEVGTRRWYIRVLDGSYDPRRVYIPGPQTVEELDLLVRMLGGKK